MGIINRIVLYSTCTLKLSQFQGKQKTITLSRSKKEADFLSLSFSSLGSGASTFGMTMQRTKDMTVAKDPTKKNGKLNPPMLYKVDPIKGPF